MKYLLYLLLIYILLPINSVADFIMIVLFYVAITETCYFTIVCAFIAGLLVDLYYPSMLGLNILIFLVLTQSLLLIKPYVAQTLITIFGLFMVFFLINITVHHVIIAFDISLSHIVLTLVFFLPIYALLNRLLYRSWMKA